MATTVPVNIIPEIHKTKWQRMSISILVGEFTLAFIATYIIIGEIVVAVLLFCGIGALSGQPIYDRLCNTDNERVPKICDEMTAEGLGIFTLFFFSFTALASVFIYILYHWAHLQWCSKDATVPAETVENPPENIVITDKYSCVVNGRRSIGYAMAEDVRALQKAFAASYISSVLLLIFGWFCSAVLMYILGPFIFNPVFILLENKPKSKSQ